MTDFVTIRAYTQAIAIMEQSYLIQSIYEDMNEVWLSLHTPDKKCPIVEQVGTNIKRRLVRQYTIAFINKVRKTIGFDICSKVADSDNAFWSADDIVLRISDSEVKDHFSMFKSLFNAIFGLSIKIIDFAFKDKIIKNDLINILSDYYYLDVNEVEHDINDEISLDQLKELFETYLKDNNKYLFKVDSF